MTGFSTACFTCSKSWSGKRRRTWALTNSKVNPHSASTGALSSRHFKQRNSDGDGKWCQPEYWHTSQSDGVEHGGRGFRAGRTRLSAARMANFQGNRSCEYHMRRPTTSKIVFCGSLRAHSVCVQHARRVLGQDKRIVNQVWRKGGCWNHPS